jgi:hypothetical protein
MTANLTSLTKTGFYEPFRLSLNRFVGFAPTDQVPVTSIIAGAISGAVGGKPSIISAQYFGC